MPSKVTSCVRLAAVLAPALLLAPLSMSAAHAADWPERAVQIVVPFNAGGDTDFNARLLAKYLEPELGVAMPVVNVSGAGGSIGARQVLDAEPDGYTVLLFHTAMLVNTASGLADFSFNDLEVSAIVGREPGAVLVVNGEALWQTLDELMEASSANPGSIDLTTNIGATTYLIGSMINQAGAAFNFVDVGGSSNRLTAVLGGNVDVSQNPLGQVAPYLETGELRALATVALDRSEALPDVLTFQEQGYEDVGFQYAFFFAFPPGTEPAVVEALSEAAGNIVEGNADYQQELYDTYRQVPFYLNTADAIEFLTDQETVINAFEF